jgi:hypothetical protein
MAARIVGISFFGRLLPNEHLPAGLLSCLHRRVLHRTAGCRCSCMLHCHSSVGKIVSTLKGAADTDHTDIKGCAIPP